MGSTGVAATQPGTVMLPWPAAGFRDCDEMVANVTQAGFSGLKKRDGLGRRSPRGAGVRDEFGRPLGRLVALRHGHRAHVGAARHCDAQGRTGACSEWETPGTVMLPWPAGRTAGEMDGVGEFEMDNYI